MANPLVKSNVSEIESRIKSRNDFRSPKSPNGQSADVKVGWLDDETRGLVRGEKGTETDMDKAQGGIRSGRMTGQHKQAQPETILPLEIWKQ